MSLEKKLQIRDKIIKIFNDNPGVEMYSKVLDVILESLESKYGIFGFINEEGNLVTPSITKDVWDKCQIIGKDIVFPRKDWVDSKAIWARAIIEGKTYYSNKPFKTPEGHIPMLKALVVPIKHQNNVIGTLEVANKETDYNENDINLLETIATYISPILQIRLKQSKTEKILKESQKDLKDLRQKYNDSKKKLKLIDEIDKQILNELFLDGTKSLIHMKIKAKHKAMSHTGIKNRIKKLINSSILKIQGNVNFNNLQLETALIRIEFNNYDNIYEYYNKYINCSRIFLISKITGQFHIIMGVVGKSLDDLNRIINYCILTDRNKIKSSDITFASEILKPQFLPFNIFNINNKNTNCGKNCLECEAFRNDHCFGCNFI
ncbi:MAG: GAF domain-containing protein [Promethearchaeota archaeon]